MANPAARIGDTHVCPKVTPGTPPVPHVGGLIVGPGCQTVLIEGQPAATTGDLCICVGEPDMIVAGSSGVFIGGKHAARMGDRCKHGGEVISGSATVLIGGSTVHIFFKDQDKEEDTSNDKEEYKEPSAEEKIIFINQAIQECITLLDRKLTLMENIDPDTREHFEKWFGLKDEVAHNIILERIRRAVTISRILTIDNFGIIEDEKTRRDTFAIIISEDEFYTFYLGDLFWVDENTSVQSKSLVLVHELSHFYDIGNTFDHEYGIPQCLDLAKNYPAKALYNAESFERFIKS